MVSLLARLEVFVRFLMVCDLVCMISIANLINLSKIGVLCVFVGREKGLWVMGIVGLFSLSLFDKCILRAFF